MLNGVLSHWHHRLFFLLPKPLLLHFDDNIASTTVLTIDRQPWLQVVDQWTMLQKKVGIKHTTISHGCYAGVQFIPAISLVRTNIVGPWVTAIDRFHCSTPMRIQTDLVASVLHTQYCNWIEMHIQFNPHMEVDHKQIVNELAWWRYGLYWEWVWKENLAKMHDGSWIECCRNKSWESDQGFIQNHAWGGGRFPPSLESNQLLLRYCTHKLNLNKSTVRVHTFTLT